MQLWFKKGLFREYAMNKPPEKEIYPNTKPIEFTLWPTEYPKGMRVTLGPEEVVKWDLEMLEGAEMIVDFEGHPSDVFDRVAEKWAVHERHRTHCPDCWEKIIEMPAFMHTEMAGHESFHCPANKDYDDRFPRES